MCRYIINTTLHDVGIKVTQAYEGPLPLPDFIGKYEAAIPGSGDRIICMAEEAQRANIDARLIPIRAEAAALKVATVGVTFLPWMLFTLATLMIFANNEVGAITAGIGGFVTWGPQVIASTRRPRQQKK